MGDHRRTTGDSLDRRIAAAEANRERKLPRGESRAEGRGWAVGIEFVGAVLVCAVIGVLLDRWLHSSPIALIVLLILGFAAGLRRAMVTSTSFDADPNNDDR